jgi:hypothetical protein
MVISDDHARSVEREHVDDVLVAFWEWLRIQEARWRDDAYWQEFHTSPSIAAGEPLRRSRSRVVAQDAFDFARAKRIG